MSVNSVVKHCVMPKDMYVTKMWKSEKVYIGESEYDICVSPASKKNGAIQFHIAALSGGEVVRFMDLNKSLLNVTIEKYLDELNTRLAKVLEQHIAWQNTGNHDLYISYGGIEQWEEGTSLKETGIRIILMVKNVQPMPDTEEKLVRKLLKAEVVEWIEAVCFDKPAIEKTKEDYENDIVNVMDISMLPHEKNDVNPVPIMTFLGLTCAILAVFYYGLLVFQVCSLVICTYAAYRAYQEDNKGYMTINALVAVWSLYFIYYGYVNAA